MRILDYKSRKYRRRPFDEDAADAAISRAVSWVTMAAVLAVDLVVICLTIRYAPSNHWSWDVRVCYVVPLPALIWLIVVWRRRWVSGAMRLGLLLCLLMLVLTLVVVDRCNLLVQYDVWTARGMPARWEIR